MRGQSDPGGAPTLQFLGGADSVTGSRFLIEFESTRLLVDCGMFQGYKVLRERNRAPFPIAPDSITAVVLTHAHLDHSGYVPALVRDGFSGPVYATAGTTDLAGIMLPDSGYLAEEEAKRAERHGYSKHAKPRPLYTAEDAERSLQSFVSVDFDAPRDVGRGIRFTLIPAGHILGASGVRVEVGGRSVRFTGDLGRPHDPIMLPPRPLEHADVFVTESTYGDRTHPTIDPEEVLADVVNRVVKRGGVVLIPAFAVGRTETVLYHLSRLIDSGRVPDVPVYLNSPMAIDAAGIYQRYPHEHRVDPQRFRRMYDLANLVHDVDESKLLNLRGGPMIILSASGMLTGGRILHHLAAYGGDRKNAIVLVGYQAGGTRGSALLGGATSLRIFGGDVQIRAEVVSIDGMSAHADADELFEWLSAVDAPPEIAYAVHGEREAADSLRARLKQRLGWQARVPEHLERVRI
ncbi:MBL fold metallo-hydrolase RNA specificity domain-containing protein [Microbacterium immunditiarum]|uniref:Metallo-beta-lactamase family protein n=1 Tax=Microbacterium immunditiarum TaxID=337480 RepID=A0A7Y9KMM8_9MICO|nr:MBL fold metallo-hydrolase [Microbacterium immunditiarum]NYE21503.1 metallo-beta-lactamase family protein [Microbacterium immunditiarum]